MRTRTLFHAWVPKRQLARIVPHISRKRDIGATNPSSEASTHGRTEGSNNARKTLFLYGQITSGLPLSLLLDPSFSPTEITFQVGVGADKASNDIPQTQLFAEDLRQIVEGITIRIPVTLTEYYPGKGFSDDRYQIVISLSLLKNGGLKLDI